MCNTHNQSKVLYVVSKHEIVYNEILHRFHSIIINTDLQNNKYQTHFKIEISY